MGDSGFFVSVEGLDGCGKTTQVGLLAQALAAAGRRVTVVRDPGSTALGERVRDLLLEPSGEVPMDHWAETALFLASRLQLTAEVIRPALAEGRVVLSDRYLDSTLAYQGARGIPWPELLDLHRRCGLNRLPDLTLVLDLPAAVALARRPIQATPDRMEQEDSSYHEQVRAGYLELAAAFPDRIVVLDAREPAAELARRCEVLVKDRLSVGRAV